MRFLNQLNLRLCLGVSLLAVPCLADTVAVGSLSFDTFIPAAGGVSGVNAFDLANLTGSFSLAPDFPVTDNLVFEAATLTLTLSDASQARIPLGEIGPGFLVDASGNPVVQVPGNESLVSAEFAATLSPASFRLSGGRVFAAESAAIDLRLMPSSGEILTADRDQTVLVISGAPITSATPEPASCALVLIGLAALLGLRKGNQILRVGTSR